MAQQQQAESQAQQQQQQFNNEMTAAQVQVMREQQEVAEGRLELEIIKEQNNTVFESNKQSHTEEIEEGEQLLKVEKQDHAIQTEREELRLKNVQVQAGATIDLAEAEAQDIENDAVQSKITEIANG